MYQLIEVCFCVLQEVLKFKKNLNEKNYSNILFIFVKFVIGNKFKKRNYILFGDMFQLYVVEKFELF